MMQKIRVNHLIETLSFGGAERRLIADVLGMDRTRFTHEVCYLFGCGEQRQALEQAGVRVTGLNLASPYAVPAAIGRVTRWLKASRPDLLHTQVFWADQVGRIAARLVGVPVVTTLQLASYEPDVPDVYSRKRRWVDRQLGRRGTAAFIAVSEWVRQSTIRRLGYAPETIHVIPNHIQLERFANGGAQEAQRVGDEIRYRMGAATNPLVVVVARIVPSKGHAYLLEAIARLRPRWPGLRVAVLGQSSPWKAWVDRRAAALGIESCVSFLGIQPEIEAWLAAADLFVLPTLCEGLPVSLLEAMAAGCACVSTRIPPVQEIIEHGATGWLCEPADSDSLAAAMNDLLVDASLRERLGRAAREAVKRFDSAQHVARLEQLYLSLVPRTPHGAPAAEAPAELSASPA